MTPSPHIGDFWPRCPLEWSPKSAVITARSMLERYSPAKATELATMFRASHFKRTWGYVHWGIVIELLGSKNLDKDAEEILSK